MIVCLISQCPIPATSRISRGGSILPRPIRQPRNNNTTPKPPGAQEAGLEDRHDGETLGIGEDLGWDDLIGSEGLAGIDEGCEDAAAFLALACGSVLLAILCVLQLLYSNDVRLVVGLGKRTTHRLEGHGVV